jgi:hypothetical protein
MTEYNSPFGRNIRSVFDRLPVTPPRALFGDREVDLFSSPGKKIKLGSGASGGPPDAPSKRKKIPILGLSVLKGGEPTVFCQIFEKIGEGSFGNVHRIQFNSDTGNPNSPSFALKTVHSGRASPKDLSVEGEKYGKPGCNWGVAMTTHDGTFFGVSTLAKPLSEADITPENIEEIIYLTSVALREADISVVNDANPYNIGIIEPGTPTVIFGEDGLPCAGPPILEKTVKIIDVGPVYEPENANPQFSAMISAENMRVEKDVMKYRRFKCDVMTAWLWNRLLAEPRNEYDIVREICKSEKYGYTYAAGDKR